MFGRRRGRAGARLLTADRAVLCVVLSGLCALRLLHLQLRPPEHVGLVIIQPTPARAEPVTSAELALVRSPPPWALKPCGVTSCGKGGSHVSS